MNTAVNEALMRCFAEKRVVFWYDEGGKCRAEFDESEVEGVEKLVIGGNEFGIKYRILAEKPDGKFLVYSPQARPDAGSDWLYDLYLAGGTFSTDPVSMTISEMGFRDDDRTRAFIQSVNPAFFKSETRKRDVKALMSAECGVRSAEQLELILICVVCKIKGSAKIEYVVAALLKELAENKTDRIDELAKYGFEAALWKRLGIDYGYQNGTNPSVVDFANKLFHDAFYPSIRDERYLLSHAALSFFNDWKNGVRSRDAFKALSKDVAAKLNVAADIDRVPMEVFGALDVFREIDEKIVKSLVAEAERGSMRIDDATRLIGQRKDGCYWLDFANAYQACEAAVRFFAALSTADMTSVDAPDAIRKYAGTWCQIDRHYRLFVEHYNAAKKVNDNAVDLFASLKQKVDGFYVSNYLMKQSVSFQGQLNGLTEWKFDGIRSQKDFWKDWVEHSETNVCVIISDALRYEIGQELAEAIEATHRYSATISPMVSMLPSYTQLGMAALLPHEKLDLAGGPHDLLSEWVYADGKSTKGLEARKAILEGVSKPRATAANYKDVMEMTQADRRAFESSANVLYIYHNTIDKRGDKRETEDETPAAAREAITEIMALIRKIGGDYRIHKFIVTADHGFLYQDCPLDASQYVADEECIYRANVCSNRFVLGWQLAESQVLANYKSENLRLEPLVDVRIAKGIMRMHKQGSGVKFVHGGASLQEIVVPVIEIQHVRSNKADVVPVEAEILVDGAGRVTTNRFSVSVYQTSPVGEEFSKRIVRLSLRSRHGDLLSDEVSLVLDSEAETVQDRTKSTMLTLNHAANVMGSGSVLLKMETGRERGNGRIDYDVYKEKPMTLRLAVQNFFD